jgi:iron complex transport system ATP-binding protein
MMDACLQFDKVEFSYRPDGIRLDNFSLEVKAGEFVGIAGPNGSGKSTVLKLADGLLRPSAGSVKLFSSELAGLSRRQIARTIAYVSQEGEMPFSFTVLEAVLMGRYPHLGILGLEGERDVLIARRAIAMATLEGLEHRLVNDLSGGEKQRVSIARAMAQEPSLLLLDEPTAHLDFRNSARIMETLKNIQSAGRLTAIIASHDLNLVSGFVDRLIFIDSGRIVADGRPGDVITRENLERVYGVGCGIARVDGLNVPLVIPYGSNFKPPK